jgi:hypothetical protein
MGNQMLKWTDMYEPSPNEKELVKSLTSANMDRDRAESLLQQERDDYECLEDIKDKLQADLNFLTFQNKLMKLIIEQNDLV